MKYDCVQAKMDAAIAKYPAVAAILADPIHGGWMGNEMPIDALVGSDAELRQAIWQYSAACQYEGDPRYHRENARAWHALLCGEQMRRVSGGRCDALTEYRCAVWRASFSRSSGTLHWSCTGCAQGVAHESSMQERAGYNLPVYTPIDGQTGGQ